MKRGPKVGDFYHVTGSHKITRDLDDLARRRTAAFLDSVGVESRPLSHILREAWLQGVKTAPQRAAKKYRIPRYEVTGRPPLHHHNESSQS